MYIHLLHLVVSAPAPLEVPQGQAPLPDATVVSPPPPPTVMPVVEAAALGHEVEEEEEEEDGGRAAPLRRRRDTAGKAVVVGHLELKWSLANWYFWGK